MAYAASRFVWSTTNYDKLRESGRDIYWGIHFEFGPGLLLFFRTPWFAPSFYWNWQRHWHYCIPVWGMGLGWKRVPELKHGGWLYQHNWEFLWTMHRLRG